MTRPAPLNGSGGLHRGVMKIRMSLLTGAAMGLVLAAGAAPSAAMAAVAAISAEKMAAEIEILKAQIASLSERLLAQERAKDQVVQQTEAAQAETTAQIKTIPTQVSTAMAAAKPDPKTSWAEATKISGRIFYNITTISQKKDGTKVAPSWTDFALKRFYTGVDHKFDETFSANITTDVQYNSAEGLTQFYIKKAYLQAKVSVAMTLRLGSADLPWVPFVNGQYGYRFVEKPIADRTKFGTSADWGLHASGKLGMIDYAVAAINGSGYKNPTISKGIDLEGRLSTTFENITLAVGGYSGKLGNDDQGVTTYHKAQRLDALVAYKAGKFRVGMEYFTAKNWRSVTSVATDNADGYSVFGSYNFTPEVAVFSRYDRVKPNKTSTPGLKETYFNLGMNYQPVRIVDLALVYKRDKVEGGSLSTANGTIGGAVSGTYDKIGLFGRLHW